MKLTSVTFVSDRDDKIEIIAVRYNCVKILINDQSENIVRTQSKVKQIFVGEIVHTVRNAIELERYEIAIISRYLLPLIDLLIEGKTPDEG